MNLLFTDSCNRNCPYCFAKGKVSSRTRFHGKFITLKNLRTVLSFLKKSNQTALGVLGGEPTLHPEFNKAMAMIFEQGLSAAIFSNGLIKRPQLSFLKGIDVARYTLLLNINSPKSYSKQEWFLVNRTIKILSKATTLSFNIYQPDFDMEFMAELIQKYDMARRQIRIGMAAPIVGASNAYLKAVDFPKVARKIVKFAETYSSVGISFSFDCGFLRCSFTDEQFKKLVRLGTAATFVCKPAIDVSPDLMVWHCFPTSKLANKSLSDFKDLEEARKFYADKFQVLRRVGTTEKCFRCDNMKSRLCGGGCLARTMKALKFDERLESGACY